MAARLILRLAGLLAPSAEVAPEHAYLNPDLMYAMRIFNSTDPTAQAQHLSAGAALDRAGLTSTTVVEMLLRTGWPVDLQVLCLQARLGVSEIEEHVAQRTRPDPHSLLTLAMLHGSGPA